MVLGEGKVESHQPTVERCEELNINNINFEIVYFSFAPRSSAFLVSLRSFFLVLSLHLSVSFKLAGAFAERSTAPELKCASKASASADWAAANGQVCICVRKKSKPFASTYP